MITNMMPTQVTMEKSINIPSKIESINLVEKLVDEISEESAINSEVYGKILIATVEAVNNSIVHGNKEDDSKRIDITFNVSEEKVSIFVEDEGDGFDFDAVPDPTKPENIENIHGRGVYLMQHLADEVEFHGKGNRVELIFNMI
ncbi:MAG: ATP-binding protein [Bacteroidales bacterium]